MQGTPPQTGALLEYEAVQNTTSTLNYKLFWNQWALVDVINLKAEGKDDIGVRLGNFKEFVATGGYWVRSHCAYSEVTKLLEREKLFLRCRSTHGVTFVSLAVIHQGGVFYALC